MINLERLERSRQGEGESQAENRVEIKMTAQPRTCHTALFHPHTLLHTDDLHRGYLSQRCFDFKWLTGAKR